MSLTISRNCSSIRQLIAQVTFSIRSDDNGLDRSDSLGIIVRRPWRYIAV